MQLTPLLQEIKGIYNDRARDRIPNGSVWECVDWIPEVLQAGARMRGAWLYQSDALPNEVDGMLYAPYKTGSRLLAANGADIRSVSMSSIASTSIGTIPATKQNPVFHRNRVVVPANNGTSAARLITFDGTSFTLTDAPASALTGRFATVWKDRVVLGNKNLEPQQMAYSKPGDPTVAWDAISILNTSYDLTGLAAQRTQVLAFHASSVERARGTTPPDSTLSDPTGDLILDVLFDRAGCYDARSIANWNDNILFCDERGIHLTDGAVVRNVAEQAGVLNLWRLSFERAGSPPLSAAAVVHRDYYIVTLRHTGLPPITFVAHIPTRRVFTLGNIDSTAYAFSVGSTERLWGTDGAVKKVTDLTPVFKPDSTVDQIDADGTPVLPVISTGWEPLTRGSGFKRVLDVFVSYEAKGTAGVDAFDLSYVNTPTGADQLLGQLRTTTKYVRAQQFVRRRLQGMGVKLTQLVATKDSRLYGISVGTFAEEESAN